MDLTLDAGSPAVVSLDRVIAMQQIDHPASIVSRACHPVGTRVASRAALQADAACSPVGNALEWLSEQAYGYRRGRDRLARRAASAGAMYPVELLWLASERGHWQLFVHDFSLRRTLRRPDDADALARMLGLATAHTALLPVAVVWRTVQRYGFRGYRYCVLDTAQVLGNITALAVAAGLTCAQAVIQSPREVSGHLGLGRTELLMPVLVLGPGVERLGEMPLPNATHPLPAQRSPGSFEETPGLAPVMTRVHRLHLCSEPRANKLLDLGGLSERRTLAESLSDLDRRESARSFAPDGLSRDQVRRLHTEIEDFLSHVPADFEEALDIRLVRRSDTLLTAARLTGGRLPAYRCSLSRSPAHLKRIFAQQPLAATATIYVIAGLRGGRGRMVELSTYRQGLLLAGLLTSRLYRYCAAAGLATTALGGFDDEAIANLAGGGFIPLIVQAVGNPHGANLKNDGLAATWLQPGDDARTWRSPVDPQERHTP
jgi:hypothetical protein